MLQIENPLTRERIKRFNDIYSMLFLVVTIVLSVGVNSFEKENLNPTVGIILVSLAFWMVGHVIGVEHPDSEVQLKIIAWAFALLVASTVLLKFAIGVATLSLLSSWLCLFTAFSLSILALVYLKEALSKRQQKQLFKILGYLVFASLIYAVSEGIIVL